MRRAPSVLALLVALGVFVGCGSGASTDSETVGTHVTGWSEAHDDRDAVYRFNGRPSLVRDAGELAAVIDLASPELDTTDLERVDLDEVVLVVGAFPRCDEFSSVEVADDGATLRFKVTKPDADNPTLCSWSPVQVVVWEVPRAVVADDVRLEVATDD